MSGATAEQGMATRTNYKEIEASCDSGFSTDTEADTFSDSDVSPPSKNEVTLQKCDIQDSAEEPEFPLNRTWSFYYLNNKSKNWDERISKVADISTVQQFWRVYNHIKLPTHISVGCDLMFFQSNVEPKWENPENCEGGRLVIEMTKEFRNEVLITNWINTLLGLIGESCDVEGVATCYGVQFQSRRKMDKISLWVGSGHSRNEIKNLGSWFLDGVRHIVGDKVKYNLHTSSAGKTTSR